MSNTLCDQIVINLTVLSNVPENGRICVSRGWTLSIEHDSWLQGLWRYANGESRKNTLGRIRQIVNDAIEYSKDKMTYINDICSKDCAPNHYEKARYDDYCLELNTIREKMCSAVIGIERLKLTYKDDHTTLAGLDRIIEMMKTHIKRLEDHAIEYSQKL